MIKKHCRGCGKRLNTADGAFWKADNRCLVCRLAKYTGSPAKSTKVTPYPVQPVQTPAILMAFFTK